MKLLLFINMNFYILEVLDSWNGIIQRLPGSVPAVGKPGSIPAQPFIICEFIAGIVQNVK